MGCLNSNQNFEHWFANIHLSGPCNRSCYFCIGQWMPGQDMNNNLGDDDLLGYDEFLNECKSRNITEVNITGTNTDPLLFQNLIPLLKKLREDGFTNIGIRTNAVAARKLAAAMSFIDKFSISITSFDADLYRKTMGGKVLDTGVLTTILNEANKYDVAYKLNVVLCPEIDFEDISWTISNAIGLDVKKINFREPYGQSHIGDPFKKEGYEPDKYVFGNPCYVVDDIECTYWDVHYTEVESVNLYADGHVSVDYPVSRGHSNTLGEVHDQSHFATGRQREQWIKFEI